MSAVLLHVVCAWCRCVIREGDRTAPHSHGICPACAKRLEESEAA